MSLYSSFPNSSDSIESACNAGDPGSIPRLGRSPGEGNGYPLQYSCLENSMDRGFWRDTVHGVAKSWVAKSRTQLSNFHFISRHFTTLPGRKCPKWRDTRNGWIPYVQHECSKEQILWQCLKKKYTKRCWVYIYKLNIKYLYLFFVIFIKRIKRT